MPEVQRAIIIGRGGATIKELQARTAARVNVPGRDRPAHHPVRVEAEDIFNLLHLCWEFTILGIGRDEPVDCTVVTSEGSVSLALQQRSSGEFLSGSGLTAFSVASCCSREELDILVDNEHFARPELSVTCLVKQCSEDGMHRVFIYGKHNEELRALFDSLVGSVRAVEARKLGDLWAASAASRDALPPRTFTVGSYNLLHPTYAQKYREREGIGCDGASNWAARVPHIARMLSASRLDVYLLQEVDQAQAAELVRVGGIADSYDLHHCTHPNREAQDGVAVLLQRECFSVAAREQIPFDARTEQHRGEHYMCAAATFARHLETGLRLVFVSVHLYPKKSIDPQATLLAFLERRAPDFDAAVWGGDCNHVYVSPPAGFAWEPPQGHAPTRRASGKKIDWLFCSRNCSLAPCGAADLLADASRQAIPETGSPPSDHFAVAAAVTLLQ